MLAELSSCRSTNAASMSIYWCRISPGWHVCLVPSQQLMHGRLEGRWLFRKPVDSTNCWEVVKGSHRQDGSLTWTALFMVIDAYAGGVIQDAMLGQQSLRGLRQVFAPKLDALSAMTASGYAACLQNMMLFSSIASLLGSPGQGNYAAANAAMDAAASQGQSQVLPSLFALDAGASINAHASEDL